ncbi:MAG: hypothetical protein WCI51_08670 [Lentisphaerota bacterium]
MTTIKIHVIVFNFAVLAVLMLTSAATAEKIKAVDGFEYVTEEQLNAKWTIAATGFSGPVKIRLNTKDAKEGRQCLEVILPATKADGIARLTLDVSTTVLLRDIAQVRFWLLVDRPESAGASGLYLGDKEWKNYFVRYDIRKNQYGWQKICVSLSDFKKEGAEPSLDTVTQMRISLWFPGNQPANRILVDELVWDNVEEKSLNLNREWWE